MSSDRNHFLIALDYAHSCLDGKINAGKWVKLACQRFLKDLERAEDPACPFVFSREQANRACRFIELLPHVQGSWGKREIVLHPSHVFATVNIFGFRLRSDPKRRRFTTALFAVARKNAKSTWAAGVLLYCFVAEGENGPQVVSAATTGSQARMIFNIASRMVVMTPAMRAKWGLDPRFLAIRCRKNGGEFMPINSKASSQDGLNPSAVGIDEVHAHKTHDLINVLKSAAGARANPLFLYTTTEGYENPGPWAEIRHFVKQLLEGTVEADHYWGIIYAIDKEDNEFDEECWQKANPLMDVNEKLKSEIAKEAVEAKSMPGKHAEFKIKRCNRQSSVSDGFIDILKWNACPTAPIDWNALANVPCYGGLDLSSTRDIASFRLTWHLPSGAVFTLGRRWVPADCVKNKTNAGVAIYGPWVESGHLLETPGDVIDYDFIEKEILDLNNRFKIKMVAYDKWNSSALITRLIDKKMVLRQFIQGTKSYHPTMQYLERAYVKGQLHHEGDPVLRWCASNLVVRYDANLNMAPDRKKSSDKIDDVCALLMSIGAYQSEEKPPAEPTIYFL